MDYGIVSLKNIIISRCRRKHMIKEMKNYEKKEQYNTETTEY
jgi:hypothetical protein